MVTRHQRDRVTWNPGLDNGSRRLADVYRTMPKDPAIEVPWYVRMVENPSSPVALAGAVDLFGHDCIHIVLGRGLLQQDEAFVIGFTMGASRSCSNWQRSLFRFCARRLYQGVYQFSKLDSEVLEFAVDAGRWTGALPLHLVDFRALLQRPLHEVRRILGVKPDVLRSFYEIERTRWHTRPAFGCRGSRASDGNRLRRPRDCEPRLSCRSEGGRPRTHARRSRREGGWLPRQELVCAVGTMWGQDKALEMLAAAGFAPVDVEHVEGDVLNNYYVARMR